ncbi:hypothetical protein CAPTEDRAFT_22458, partial [Capitella teleta]
LHLMGFASISVETSGWNSAGCVPGIEIAIADLNDRDDILAGYELVVDMKDTRVRRGIKALYEHLNTPPKKVMIIGGGCSEATTPVARTAPYLGLVQVSFSAGSPDLSRRDLYKTFFRTIRSDLFMVPSIIALCHRYGWHHIATIHQQYHLFASTVNELHALLPLSNITLVTGEVFDHDAKTNLQNIKSKNARIIFYNSYAKEARRAFCYIYELGMYGPRYQWIIPGWWANTWMEMNDTSCTPEQVQKAAEYTITINDLLVDMSGAVTDSGQTYQEYLQRYQAWPSRSRYGYNPYHTFGYDATWAIGLALNTTVATLDQKVRYLRLEDFTYDENSVITTHIFDAISKVNFHGFTGPVYFNKGERSVVADIQQLIGNTSVRVMHYEERGDSLTDVIPIQWQGTSTLPNFPDVRRAILYNSEFMVYTIFALAGIGILFALLLLGFNLRNTDHLHIRMSSPKLNNIIILGTILAYSSCILFGLDTTMVPVKFMGVICKIKTWFLAVSFSLSFGAMFAKTWRVHLVFTQMTVAYNKPVRDVHLISMVGGLLCTDVIILVTWATIDTQTVVNHLIEVTEFDDHITYYYAETCGCQHQWFWSGAFFAIKGLLLIFGCFLAYETRSVNLPGLNDSKFIGMCVYNVVVLCVVGITVSLVMRDKQTVTYAFQASCMILCATTTLSLLFLPKVSPIPQPP